MSVWFNDPTIFFGTWHVYSLSVVISITCIDIISVSVYLATSSINIILVELFNNCFVYLEVVDTQ
jgi:hypothetical protein